MVKNGSPCLYTEARLNIEPAFPDSTISITLPATSTSTFSQQTRPKRVAITENYGGLDEDAFSKRHLASDGSMFFRKTHIYPRSFLWRILDDRRTLEVQAADLDHDIDHKKEANLTLLFRFSSPIRPFCVAFAEPDDRDALIVFAITDSCELYTLTLHRDFFSVPDASEQDITDWCKRTKPNLLNAQKPYRLVAVGANELLVSLDNGGIVRLTRDKKDETLWQEDLYQEHHWSLRGILPWKGQHTIRFNNSIDLVPSSAATMAVSPDGKHIISACLDHRLRIFNIASGKLTLQRDLLHQPDGSHERNPPYFIGPSQHVLLQVVSVGGDHAPDAEYFLVTYSPLEHQFKFWGVRDADNDLDGIYDVRNDIEFSPPIDDLMDATVWTMEEFVVVPGPSRWRDMEIWIRARSGPSSKVYSLTFDLKGDSKKLVKTWKSGWATVHSGPLTVEELRNNPTNPGEQEHDSEHSETNLSDQWLDFLFLPGRFTTATLEAAHTYLRKGIDTPPKRPQKGPLKERLCATINALASTTQRGVPELDNYGDAVAQQWQSYYGIVKDMHKRRGEALCLVYDHKLDMPWLVLSDYLSAIRKCGEAEVITLNAAMVHKSQSPNLPLSQALPQDNNGQEKNRDVARLLNAATLLRRRFPRSFQQALKQQVELDMLQSRSLTVVDRMEQMDLNCDLSQLLTEDDLAVFLEELGTELDDLDTSIFIEALQVFTVEADERPDKRKQIARYGLSALLRISQETLERNYDVMLDLLVVVLFMHFEENLSAEFDASKVFVELMTFFKDYLVLKWLATTVWSHQAATSPATEALMVGLGETYNTTRFPMTQVILEGIHGLNAHGMSLPSALKSERLTWWSLAWLRSFFNETFDEKVDETMGILLVQKEYALAMEFSRFSTTSSAWSTYLKGRMHLALGENARASICFQRAAHNLALSSMFDVHMSDSANILTEIERGDFSEGLARFYHHVLTLFEKAKAHSYAADFAHLGLRSLTGNQEMELKTEFLQRLFTASVQTSRFTEAYTALIRHSDPALQHSSLQKLITSMVSQSQTVALLKFPFVGLRDDVDGILSSLCHRTLNLASGPPYHQILYSFRISRGDFRGAATILYERLQRLKSTSSKIHDPGDESLAQCYLLIINALLSVSAEDAYIVAEQRIDDSMAPAWTIGKAKKMLKRHVVTLEMLRKEYQAELDRVAAIESGQFPFVDPADDMDIL
ncbi:hypothetical protein DM02DRAFT_617248 [Periconia macrospinosa]|uniref:Nucleoporin Nup120/160 n=1 Tax=Periconia macrospinosa TaxID=97972 RepID=A0A2V1DEF5_9PLEO|nr:hypothetical protein DM02DRAFT_617248 [Periconia macrospinosa]